MAVHQALGQAGVKAPPMMPPALNAIEIPE
jgi:hypothetical protein